MSRISALKHRILRFCYVYALLLGIISLRYDWRSHRLTRSKLRTCYAYAINVAQLLVTPLSMRAILNQFRNYGNPLLRQQFILNVLFRFSAVVLTILTRWWRERHLLQMASQLRQLHRRYFDRWQASAELRDYCDRVFCWKFLTTASQGMTLLFNAWRYMSGEHSILSVLSATYAYNLHNLLHLGMLLYFGGLWCARERFGVLNEQLAALYVKLRHNLRQQSLLPSDLLAQLQLADAGEVLRLARVHLAMYRFVRQLNVAFQHQVSAVLLTYMVNNISMGYNAALYYGGELDNFAMGFASLTYCMLSLDLYLLYWACEETTVTYQRTAVLLQRFTEFPPLMKEMQQSLDTFSLQLMQHQLRIRMCGMYSLNKASFFVVLAQTLLNTIILVQFDLGWHYREPIEGEKKRTR